GFPRYAEVKGGESLECLFGREITEKCPIIDKLGIADTVKNLAVETDAVCRVMDWLSVMCNACHLRMIYVRDYGRRKS
ncbi:MAG: hypothetical protein ABIH76_04125, partial [Candidatus Bathyarchaeota archaeon]